MFARVPTDSGIRLENGPFSKQSIVLDERTHKLSTVGLPGGYLFSAHREVNRIHLHTIPCRIPLFFLLYQALIKISIGRLVKTGRETKIGKLEVAILVDQDIVRFDVTNPA